MGLAQRKPYLSVEEYLKYEKDSPIKHEYIDGQIYAMTGASKQHIRLARNICNRLDDHLADDPCEPFISDMKVYVGETLFYYPDVVVACDDVDPYYTREPILIVEVTSPITERIDRHEKLPAYKNIKSLKELLFVSQDHVQIEVYQRQSEEGWQTEILADLDKELHLQSVGLTLQVAQVYRRVQFDQAA